MNGLRLLRRPPGPPRTRPALPMIARVASLLAVFGLIAGSSHAAPECGDCHEVDHETFATSVHGGFDCTDCHAGAAEMPHEEDVKQVDCSICHDEITAEYQESLHGQARSNGAEEAPDCQTCHGGIHGLKPVSDPASPVYPSRLPETCGSCHSDPEMVRKFGIPVARPLESFRQSVHYRALGEGMHAATCSECHGSHAIFPGSDPRSTVYHARVPEMCGHCHEEIAGAYERSVHGRGAREGAREAPVCTDCHGEHRILAPTEPGSPVYASNIPKMTCGRCHGDLRLAEKYDIPTDKVPAYQDSYHGLALESGALTTANCGSCHGVHEVLPSSDPASLTNPANLPGTCGQCHPGAGKTFAIGAVHILPTEKEHAAVYWIRYVYIWMIWTTIAGMVLHNLADFIRKFKDPPVRNPLAPADSRERMPRGFRYAHGMLMVSFIVLAYSGFALKYPDGWWAAPLLRWEGSFGLRGLVHRAAAIVMMVGLVFHVAHLVVDRRARRCIAGMRPKMSDLREFRERMLYFLGLRAHPPKAEWLGYPEKLEYIALMWGTLVMAVTGFALWFDNVVLRLLPKWITDVATVIHFYEAVLASLAILVWHFYFVIFDPAVYPMDTTWLTGRSPAARAMERRGGPPADDTTSNDEDSAPPDGTGGTVQA